MASSSSDLDIRLNRKELDTDVLRSAAELFSNHYGFWSVRCNKKGRVRMGLLTLKLKILPCDGRNIYISATTVTEQLVGNVFGCIWHYQGREVCWITQLVVDGAYRRRGIATGLIQELLSGRSAAWVGILSSHPAAIRATLRATGRSLDQVDLRAMIDQGPGIMASSPVSYVRDVRLYSSLSGTLDDGTVSTADTGFEVDHRELEEALAYIRGQGLHWPCGRLPDDHEYLLILETGALEGLE